MEESEKEDEYNLQELYPMTRSNNRVNRSARSEFCMVPANVRRAPGYTGR